MHCSVNEEIISLDVVSETRRLEWSFQRPTVEATRKDDRGCQFFGWFKLEEFPLHPVIQDLGFDEHPSSKEAGATYCCWLASASPRVSLAMSPLVAERSNAA
jgi:hypothetical protein